MDIEIGTANSTRIERVRIEAKEEQTFKFTVDSEPLLVNFDYHGALIKELLFSKTDGQLMYQLVHDQDVLGRIWALQQLSARMKNDKTTSADRHSITNAISNAAAKDQFWGTRLEAATALMGGHITVAWGRDYGDVSPIHGVLLGGAKHTLDVGVDVSVLE